jgi:hypothetical protein
LENETPQPFETECPQPLRGAFLSAGEIVEAAADTHRQSDIVLIFEAIEKDFLFRGSEIAEDNGIMNPCPSGRRDELRIKNFRINVCAIDSDIRIFPEDGRADLFIRAQSAFSRDTLIFFSAI